ncbi:M20/M25/M40 family metallo-hydrolase [Campylobacter sp. RM16192]|uniref:M20/M25/M40 family metallo-hydrolase n=1 Tax=Campylobacter sp. RM16192 TaxID=1660080 RepID=UPI001451CF2C|nr:M20/M25/M40 family metallo-hydrolase [Campylobacter sp. RM16192]QCD52879.1 aminoacyl-histidine dipeptidase [Campylobacter sp. RM16192]
MQKSDVLTIFEKICEIPRCSHKTEQMREFLVSFAKDKGFSVDVDELGNIHCKKGEPKICLQSHYDMVCMGDAPNIKLYYENGIMRAVNSSLGADNGIGIAMMMSSMKEFNNLECLFTNDEEVGLIGANGFKGKIVAPNLLNLDSEEDDRVTLGCAGGINVSAKISDEKVKKSGKIYEVSVTGLPGGHSGNEIHKNIPSSIKVIGKFLGENGCELISLDFGERSNSIPSAAKCTVISANELKDDGIVKVKKVGEGEAEVLVKSCKILALINSFAQGVRSYNVELNMVNNSINMSTVKQKEGVIEFDFFGRAMSKEGLKKLGFETKTLCDALGFDTVVKDRSANWNPSISDFSNLVLDELKKLKPDAKFSAVHAGLECGILVSKQPGLEACSIGPNIHSPHSVNERCEVESVEMMEKVVRNIVARMQ